ncbi:type 4a pilus biogenesis protein PilO [Vibrio sp. 99-70-13A1]|uniref:type 4a pilus biogenesis protein PilO n=1 Tax=Vibrio sp. 99-70-13A1 TaxID=2607601 RepID=UPI001493DAC5|nr:type 4a pilus biogenesis protein PilO [Vibrio sp. 99-70-13A1]NOH96454.1 type 4a pilus biogenesis protein PilO [Vibrio sp. 99-70-13A1]
MQQWTIISDKFLALSSREKWLVTLCGVVGLSLVLFTMVLEPAYKSLQANQIEHRNLVQGNQRLQGELLVLQAKLKKNPDKDIDIEYKKLLVQSQDLSMQLSEVIDGLISPTQMTDLLENVLSSGKKLKLVSLESLKPESISNNKSTSDQSGYFLHPVRMELTGSYFDIAAYLQALEALPVRYYWRNFQYTVEEYPNAKLVFEVYTLGTRQEFIGG